MIPVALGCLLLVSSIALNTAVNFVGIPALADTCLDHSFCLHIFYEIVSCLHAGGQFGPLDAVRQTGRVGMAAVDKLVKRSTAIAVDGNTMELRARGGRLYILRKHPNCFRQLSRDVRAMFISDVIDLDGEFTLWHLEVLGHLRIHAPTVRFLPSFKMDHNCRFNKALLDKSALQMGCDTSIVFSDAYGDFGQVNPQNDHPKPTRRSWQNAPFIPASPHVVFNLPFSPALGHTNATSQAHTPSALHPRTGLVTINIIVMGFDDTAVVPVVFGAAYKFVDDLVRFVELETSVTRQIKILGLGDLAQLLVHIDKRLAELSFGDHQAGASRVTNFLPKAIARLTIAEKRHTVLFGQRRHENSNQTAEERLSRLHLHQLPFFPSACQLSSARRWEKDVGEEVFSLLTDPQF